MWGKYKDKIFFILFILQITLVYKLIQFYFVSEHVFKTPLDDRIPFVAWFVIPYILYVIVLIVVFAMAAKNKHLFLATSKACFFAATVCNITFILFPTMILRPEIFPSTIYDKIVLSIYSIDSALISCFPSEHVTFSVLLNLCLIGINKRISYVFLPLTILIVLSTLFIKQHYIPDVLSGLLLAFLTYKLVFKKHLLINSEVIVTSPDV